MPDTVTGKLLAILAELTDVAPIGAQQRADLHARIKEVEALTAPPPAAPAPKAPASEAPTPAPVVQK